MDKNDLPPDYSEVVQNATTINVEDVNLINAGTASHAYNYAIPQNKPSAPPPPVINKENFRTSYGSIPTTTTINMPTEIIVVGGCPVCRIGILENDYPCIGWLCAIAFFPLGVLFCLAMKQRRCTHCGVEFSN